MVQVSLIVTVKNEEKTIASFLEAIFNQTRLPDEIIISDGGSTDKTKEIIVTNFCNRGIPVKIIDAPGNIAHGRNVAIANAKYSLIAVTDAGTEADASWLANLIKPFESDSEVDVSFGATIPKPRNLFEEIVGIFFSLPSYSFFGSSRSLAFKKNIWEKVGGYPEHLYLSGEDTLFNIKLKKSGAKITFVPEAIVYWQPMENFRKLFYQTFSYARGNAQARTYTYEHFRNILSYTLGLVLFILSFKNSKIGFFLALFVFLYFAYYGIKAIKKTQRLGSFFLCIPIKFVIDLANLSGYLVGLYLRYKDLKRKLYLILYKL